MFVEDKISNALYKIFQLCQHYRTLPDKLSTWMSISSTLSPVALWADILVNFIY